MTIDPDQVGELTRNNPGNTDLVFNGFSFFNRREA
jgi:hypothetical protein